MNRKLCCFENMFDENLPAWNVQVCTYCSLLNPSPQKALKVIFTLLKTSSFSVWIPGLSKNFEEEFYLRVEWDSYRLIYFTMKRIGRILFLDPIKKNENLVDSCEFFKYHRLSILICSFLEIISNKSCNNSMRDHWFTGFKTYHDRRDKNGNHLS